MNKLTTTIAAAIVALCLLPLPLRAQKAGKTTIEQLQTEMYRLFYTEDSVEFHNVTAQLREACLQAGNEELFYKAWGNSSIYESTHQRRTHALEVARQMEDYAKQHESHFGTYTAMHVTATVYHQMRDYKNAEKTYKEAIDYLHVNSPGQSAAADYIELILINVNGYNNVVQGMAYAERALAEPNLSDQHRLRVLTMLCQMEGEKLLPDKETFNNYYKERQHVLQRTPHDRAENAVNLMYHLLNGNYERAMALTDSLSTIDQTLYEKARIYHATGRDDLAYQHMLRYKWAKDSMNRAERQGLLSEYITQLSSERLELDKITQEEQVNMWRNRFIISVVTLFLVVVIIVSIYFISRMHRKNVQLGKANEAERMARLAEEDARRVAEKELDVKRDFLNNIAQELRSPLNPITGFSDILATPDFELGAEERIMMSQHIKENSKLLTGIIDNMIEMSLYESRTSLPKDDLISPNVVAQNAVDFGHTRIKEGMTIRLESDFDDSLTIKSDLTAVRNVLLRLVDNATKYARWGEIVVRCHDAGPTVIFSITDIGRGIKPEMVEHIFEPVVQRGENIKSTGMSLAICKRIATLLGGSLTLDTDYHKGARFVFEIPKQ